MFWLSIWLTPEQQLLLNSLAFCFPKYRASSILERVHEPLSDILISARNRRQAMDWSLVLASQGIAHALHHADDTGWGLAVAPQDHPAALHQIQLYRRENRNWRWRQPVFPPGLFFDWTSLIWVLLIVIFHLLSLQRPDLKSVGHMSHAVFSQGEVWRLGTAIWLHADLAHLVMNALFGWLFLGLILGRYGQGVGLLAVTLAGIGGNLVTGWFHGPAFHGLGASGVVMGALGLLSFPTLILPKQSKFIIGKVLLGGLVAGGWIFLLIAVNPETDVLAHLGGFVSGWLLGLFLAPVARFTRRPHVNLIAGGLFVMLVIVPWWLALHHR